MSDTMKTFLSLRNYYIAFLSPKFVRSFPITEKKDKIPILLHQKSICDEPTDKSNANLCPRKAQGHFNLLRPSESILTVRDLSSPLKSHWGCRSAIPRNIGFWPFFGRKKRFVLAPEQNNTHKRNSFECFKILRVKKNT